MAYVDGFLAPVKAGSRHEYLAFATKASDLFKANGATRVVECWGDDVPDGKLTDFRRAVAAEEGEVVVLGWIEWPSKAVRDAGMKAMMDDEEMKNATPPFDGKRIVFGGFAPILDV